jgi:hypothetical protein
MNGAGSPHSRSLKIILRALVSLVLPLITVISLLIAIGHWKSTSVASRSLSTRYLGTFPDYMKELTRLVDNASDTLLISPGVSGYGMYSNHGDYVSYYSALQRKVGLREFKAILLDETGVKDLVDSQLLGVDFDNKIVPSDNFRQFVNWSHREKPRDMESFKRALREVEMVTRTKDFREKGINCSEIAGQMPIYVWIADSNVAVFSVPDLQTPNPQENAFITHDSRLIKQLVTIFRTYEDISLATERERARR